MKQFDLNIDRILENWECKHALREIIANGLDEQRISGTPDINIYKNGQEWIIRDYGRGLKYEHLVQRENSEKLNTNGLIGKFGIGLKDALATFDRNGVGVKIYSSHADISIKRLRKFGFNDLTTLHAIIEAPTQNIVGTEFRLTGISDQDMFAAKKMFLKFSSENIIEKTRHGDVIEKNGNTGNIYINGVLVAQEPNFLFSYNITSIDSILRKSINRERTNVGRTAYASIVRRILLACESEIVGNKLSNDLSLYSCGGNHDELRWIDVQEHAAKILSNYKKVVFVTSNEIKDKTDLVREASENSREVVVIPENLSKKIENGNTNITPESKITTLTQFIQQRSDNFEYQFVNPTELSPIEKSNYELIARIYELIGGKPSIVNSVLISETMQKDSVTFDTCIGVWEEKQNRIIIHRNILGNRARFLGTLLHELAHARSGYFDSTRGFEKELTNLLGIIANIAIH